LRAGREHLLSFNPEALDEAATWIEAQRAIRAARPDAVAASLGGSFSFSVRHQGREIDYIGEYLELV
jgi:hypothetical protein